MISLYTSLFHLASHAFSWHNLWWTYDQQGAQAMQSKKHEQAAELFQHPEWQGTAYYRAGDYKNAIAAYQQSDSAQADYNRGNAYAKLGDFTAAIDAYTEALKKQPDLIDAQYNKKLLEQANKQKEQQQKQQQPEKNENKSGQSNNSRSESQHAKENNNQSQQDKNNKEPLKQSKQDKSPSQLGQTQQEKSDAKQQNKQKTIQSKQQTEKQRENEQWLHRIPDEPGSLLQQKFLRDHLRYQQQKGAS